MPNKFQKSVLERLEQEALRQKQEQKVKTKDAVKKQEETQQEINTAEIKVTASETPATTSEKHDVPHPDVLAEIKEPEQPVNKNTTPALPDISEYLRRENQRLAKNKTFYLDSDVIEAVKTTAKAQKVTDSKLVNDILRMVLGLR